MSEIAISRFLVADYLQIGSTNELMSVFEQIDENPTAQVDEVHFTCNKTSTKNTKGYAPVFPISARMYKNNSVAEWLRDVGEEQKTGSDCETYYYRVRLYQPIEGQDNTYYARRFKVSAEISGITGAGGENMVIAGNLNSVEDVVIGEFNTVTRTFTATGTLVRLEVASVPGSDDGTTRLVVLPTLQDSNIYFIKTGSCVDMPAYGQNLSSASGWTSWNGLADITATSGDDVVVAECTTAGLARRAGKATVTSA